MAELPLLLFPSPEVASKTPGHGFGGNLKRPTAARQSQRLNPVFQQLQNSFNARSVELQQTPTGIDPEQVLVIETVGNVEDFANAVKKIEGLEWMGEFALDGISPDEDFQDKKDPEKELIGRLYLIMSNQTALTQMLSLWQRYTENPDTMNFKSGEYHGLAKFKDVFLHLKEIRRWGVEDRLAEREVFEIWQENLEFDAQRNVRFEAELWFRGSDDKRRESESIVSGLIQELGGNVISQCVIPSIAYHSVLGEIPAQTALQILEHPEVDLIKCENIMFFRPTGQMATGKEPVEGDIADCTVSADDLPTGDPVVAVLDGLPLENHRLFARRLIVDDPDDWASDLQLSNRRISPGNQVAAPSSQAGELNKSQFCFGSSNSAALTSRAASICYDYLASIFSEQAPDDDFATFGVPILKAMLVHGCSWNELGSKLDEVLRTDENGRQIKNWISRWVGYGVPDLGKALGCNEQRATLLGFGQLNDGEAHVYNLPLPPSLSAQREWRKFTVTLAWLSPVASTTQRYREAQLWFDFEDGKKSREKLSGKLRVTGIDSDSDATRRGTVQHEVFEGESAVAISDGDTLQIKVNCRKDARKIETPVAYGLVVSLEVAEGVNLPIYNEIRTRIAPAVEIRAGGQI